MRVGRKVTQKPFHRSPQLNNYFVIKSNPFRRSQRSDLELKVSQRRRHESKQKVSHLMWLEFLRNVHEIFTVMPPVGVGGGWK